MARKKVADMTEEEILKNRIDGMKYYNRNKEQVNIRARAKYAKDEEYRRNLAKSRKEKLINNPDLKELRNSKARKKYKDTNGKARKKYIAENKDKINKNINLKRKNKRKDDPIFKLRQDVSRHILFILTKQNGSKKGKSIIEFLSYTIEQLKSHIEFLFEPWMNWGNHGKYSPKMWNDNDQSTWTWQLDHIIPQSDLPYDSMDHPNFQKAWALSNLRPLSAKQNHSDGVNRIRHKQQ
jgi:hypothetical protein